MKKILIKILFTLFFISTINAQLIPVNCDLAVPGCSTPQFVVNGINPNYNVQDFGTGTISNPAVNPQGVNAGCLLTGETVSTFITITIVTNGTLEWSLIGLNGNNQPSNNGCFDWIMWNNSDGNGCTGINNNTLPPVACNWNGVCNGNTGMAFPANYPPNANNTSYQPPLNVTAGQQYILCLSNFSFTNQNVNLNFFGTAQVTCSSTTPDQTICLGESATVNVMSIGLTNPVFNWLVTTGVSNPTSGDGVVVTPTETTQYIVEITADEGVFLDTFLITVVPPPTPNAGADQVICFGQQIQLNGVVTAGSTINWTATPQGITPNPTINFVPNSTSATTAVNVNQPGVYLFTLTEDNGVCPVVSDQKQVTVSKTTHTTTFTSPSCQGMTNGTITIYNPDATEYSFDGGITWGTSNTQGGFGVGSHAVRSRNQHGCMFASTVTITEPAALVLTASADTIVCQNGIANLSAQIDVSGLAVDYVWSHTNETTPTISSGVLTSPLTVTVYALAGDGCVSNTATIQINVREPLSAILSVNDTICPGFSTNINLSNVQGGLPPYMHTWSNGELESGVGSSINVSPANTQSYSVTLSDICESTPVTLITQVYVAPLPVPAIDVINPHQCEPAVFEIHNVTDSAMSSHYAWFFPANQGAINEPIIYTDTLMAGNYDVQLIVTSPLGCIDSTTFYNILKVDPRPTAQFSWSPNPVKMFNTEVHFQNLSHLDQSYQWFFTSAVPSTSTEERPRVTFPHGEVGNYDVTLIVTSELGCTDTITKTVIISPEVLLFAPNTFTPDGDEFNQKWLLHIEGVDLQSITLEVFNRWGEVIFQSHDLSVGWDGTYNHQPVPAGTYSWKLTGRDRLHDGKYTWNGIVNVLR